MQADALAFANNTPPAKVMEPHSAPPPTTTTNNNDDDNNNVVVEDADVDVDNVESNDNNDDVDDELDDDGKKTESRLVQLDKQWVSTSTDAVASRAAQLAWEKHELSLPQETVT